MRLTRRDTLGLSASALAGLGFSLLLPRFAHAQAGDAYPTDAGELAVHPIEHASLVLAAPGAVIYADPVGAASAYAHLPPPDLILVTHEHGDHYNAETLAALAGPNTHIITNPAVLAMLPGDLADRAQALANGESASHGDIGIDAIPAYNTTADRLNFHPQGRDNGYVLSIGGRRVYIAGDTEDIPEMRALESIFLAFVPMNLPFTMDVDQAASGVAAFAPDYVYPYHYGESDIDRFEALMAESGAATEVVRRNWYA